MRTRMAIGMVLAVALWGATLPAEAGTLGQRVLSVQLGRVELGGDLKEAKDYLDDIYVYGVSLQFPLGRYFELLANASRTDVSGKIEEEGVRVSLDAPITAFSGGARIHFLPDSMFNPFISAVYTMAKVEVELKVDGEQMVKENETEKSISVAAGVEISFTDRLSLLAAFTRTRPDSKDREFDLGDSDDDRDSITAALNFWATERFLIGATFSQELEDDTRVFGVNLGLRF